MGPALPSHDPIIYLRNLRGRGFRARAYDPIGLGSLSEKKNLIFFNLDQKLSHVLSDFEKKIFAFLKVVCPQNAYQVHFTLRSKIHYIWSFPPSEQAID